MNPTYKMLDIITVQTKRPSVLRYCTSCIVQDETLEETGWKLVHGDVFRPPRHPRLLAAVVGSGIQLICSTFIVISMLDFYCMYCGIIFHIFRDH